MLPLAAGLATALVLGWLLLIAGAVGLASSLRARHAPGFSWSLLSAFAALVAGFFLLANPVQELVTLTLVLAAFFFADGIFNIALAATHRQRSSRRWEWMMLNGIFDLVLASAIVLGLPGTLIWALGLMVGVDLLFGGASLVTMALDAKAQPV